MIRYAGGGGAQLHITMLCIEVCKYWIKLLVFQKIAVCWIGDLDHSPQERSDYGNNKNISQPGVKVTGGIGKGGLETSSG